MNPATAALLGLALASLSVGCSSTPGGADATSTGSTPPPSATPTLDPELAGRIEIDQRTYRPGDNLNVRWPGEEMRGIAYSLDAWRGTDWKTEYFEGAVTTGKWPKHDPVWWNADEAGYDWADIGVSGPGPDLAIVPDTAEPGEYRLCTANSPTKSCVLVTVG